MPSSNIVAPARAVIANYLMHLAGSPSFWFILNCDHNHGFSLCRRFGMPLRDYEALFVAAEFATVNADGVFQIKYKEFQDFIKSPEYDKTTKCFNLPKDLFDVSEYRIDLDAYVDGPPRKTVKGDRLVYYALRIGSKDISNYNDKFLVQKKNGKLIQTPPRVENWGQEKRAFARRAAPYIVAAIRNDDILYDRFMNEDDNDTPSPKTKPDTPKTDTDNDSPPPPAKRTKYDTTNKKYATPSPDSNPTALLKSPPAKLPAAVSTCKTGLDEVVVSVQSVVAETPATVDDVLDKLDAIQLDLLFNGIIKRKKKKANGSVVTVRGLNNRKQSWVRVPAISTDESFRKHQDWFKSSLEILSSADGDMDEAARRLCKYLAIHHPEPMMEALKEAQYPVVEYMNETKLAAMFDDGRLNLTQERTIVQHLRHHFGKKAFATRKKVAMLSEGHTHITADKVEFAYEDGEKPVTIEYSVKDIPVEIAAQIARRLQGMKVDISKIKSIDLIGGADHGQGAFQAGVQVVIAFVDEGEEHGTPPLIFDIALAEVICRKDTALLLQKTIEPCLTKGFKTLAEEPLSIGKDHEGKIKCIFGHDNTLEDKVTVKTEMYCVGDLAFYAMVLGREHSSGFWCYLCKMSSKEFAMLRKNGEPWTYDLLNEIAKELKADKKGKVKSVQGVKEEAWWQFIPLENYLPPLLHLLIGIGNDIFDSFKDFVNDEIECLDPKEVMARHKVGSCKSAIDEAVAKRDEWDTTSDGTELIKMKQLVYRRGVALKNMGVGTTSGAATKSTTSNNDSIDALLDECDVYVDPNEVAAEEEVVCSYPNCKIESDILPQPCTSDNCAKFAHRMCVTEGGPLVCFSCASQDEGARLAEQRIAQFQKDIEDARKKIAPLQKHRDTLADEATKGRALLARLKKKLTEFRSIRKKSKGGMEAKMLTVLKKIGVELTRYHGGSLAGMDIKKVIANATFVFDEFAKLLKEEAKRNTLCKLDDSYIDNLCGQYKELYLLWDGAFSMARKTNPTKDDCNKYCLFVNAAVISHRKIGCSATHKVHIMQKHVAAAMKRVPRGLGEKMEDWVELQHQIGSRERKRTRTTVDIQKRADVRARSEQRSTNSDVIAQREEVKGDTRRTMVAKDKKGTKEMERKVIREKNRVDALAKFQTRYVVRLQRWYRAKRPASERMEARMEAGL